MADLLHWVIAGVSELKGVAVVDDAALADRVRRALAPAGSVREQAMFGGLSFMVDGQMVVSVRGSGELLVRCDPSRADELLTLPGARPATMGAGRPMGRGWLLVAPGATTTGADLGRWLAVGLQGRRDDGARGGARPGARTRR